MEASLLRYMPMYTDVLCRVPSFTGNVGQDSAFKDFARHMDTFEDRLYGYGGTQIFSDLKTFMSLELVKEDRTSSGSNLPRYIVRSVARRDSPITFSLSKDAASKLCALYSAYRLLDFIALINEPVSPISPPYAISRGIVMPPADLPPMVSRLNKWPTVVTAFTSIVDKEVRVGAHDEIMQSCDAFDRVMFYVNREYASMKRSRITLNFLIASMHLSHMRMPAGDIPDMPNSMDELITRGRARPISDDDLKFMGGLLQSNRADAGKGTAGYRIPLQYALSISPLLLLLPFSLSKIRCDRARILQTSFALGNAKEPLLVEAERLVMVALLSIGDGQVDPDIAMERLKDALNSLKINERVTEPNWFDMSPRTGGFPSRIQQMRATGCSVDSTVRLCDPAAIVNQSPDSDSLEGVERAASKLPSMGSISDSPPSSADDMDADIGVSGVSADARPVLESMIMPEDGRSFPCLDLPLMQSDLAEGNRNCHEEAEINQQFTAVGVKSSKSAAAADTVDTVVAPIDFDMVHESNVAHIHNSEGCDVGSIDSAAESCTGAHKVSASTIGSGSIGAIATAEGGFEREQLERTGQKILPEFDGASSINQHPTSSDSASGSDACIQRARLTVKRPLPITDAPRKRICIDPPLPDVLATLEEPMHSVVDYVTEPSSSARQPILSSNNLRDIPAYIVSEYAGTNMLPLSDLDAPMLKSARYSLFKPDGSIYAFETAFHHVEDADSFEAFCRAVGAIKNSTVSPSPPSYLVDPDKSQICVISYSTYELLGTTGIGDLLRNHCCVVVNEMPNERMKFDEECLKTLGPLRSTVETHDLSISIANGLPSEFRMRIATIDQILEASRRAEGKSLNALDFPMPDSPVFPVHPYSTDILAWYETAGEHGFAKDGIVPVGQMRFGMAATRGAITYTHVDPNSKGTYIDVLTGAKVWIVETGSNGESDRWRSPYVLLGDNLDIYNPQREVGYEAIVLTPGTRLIMRPNTPHMVYTPEHTVCHGGHFYSTSTMCQSLYASMHTFVGHYDITNTNHIHSGQILRRIAMFYYVGLVRQMVTSPEDQHLPVLNSMNGVLELLSLCWIVIMGNVLDHRTYLCIDQDADSDASCADRVRKEKYDINAIPMEERLQMSFARGICHQLVRWFDANYQVGSVCGDTFTQLDGFGVTFLARETHKLLRYYGIGVKHEMNGPRKCTPMDLLRQIQNVMEMDLTNDAWDSASDVPHDFNADCLGWNPPDDSTYIVRRRTVSLTGFRETVDVGALGTTDLDRIMFAQWSKESTKGRVYN